MPDRHHGFITPIERIAFRWFLRGLFWGAVSTLTLLGAVGLLIEIA